MNEIKISYDGDEIVVSWRAREARFFSPESALAQARTWMFAEAAYAADRVSPPMGR
jgi:hypothetical protein